MTAGVRSGINQISWIDWIGTHMMDSHGGMRMADSHHGKAALEEVRATVSTCHEAIEGI
jgi:hypothetical protein